MASMLTEIVESLDSDALDRLSTTLGADHSMTERAVDATVPALLAGLDGAAAEDAEAVHGAVAGFDADPTGAAGPALATLALGESLEGVVGSIASHIGAGTEGVQGVVGSVAATVGGYLANLVARDGLDPSGLAAALSSEHAALTSAGLTPQLAAWGVADYGAEADHHTPHPETGFEYDDNVGRPGWLWWLTGLITLILFGYAISQCNTGTDASATDDAAATTTTVAATTATTAAPAPADSGDPAASTVGDIATNDGRFLTLVAAADQAGLVDDLFGPGPLTVFAPTDAAFDAFFGDIGGIDTDALIADDDRLRALLLAHIAPGNLTSADVAGVGSIEMLSGDVIDVSGSGSSLRIGGAAIGQPDVPADNGVIHVMDSVIVPDGFLGGSNAMTVAAADGDFGTLLAALDAAGLRDVLEGDGPFTVFGPSDDAFDALPAGTVDALLERSDDLGAVLRYHVVEGDVRAADLTPGTVLTTVSGEELEVVEAEGGVRVGRALLVDTDIETGNGVFHTVDSVLLPRSVFPSGEPTINYVLALEPITFESGSDDLTAEGEAVLDGAVAYLLDNPVDVEIQGHTDSIGPSEPNQRLSERRATTVLEYLVANGVDEALLTAVGFGEDEPVADNDTPEGRAENRRIEFRVAG